MKIAAFICAIISGLIGLFGDKIQSLPVFSSLALTNRPETHLLGSGMLLIIFSTAIIALGAVSLKFPKTAGLLLVGCAAVAFFQGNILSAPFALLAGIFDLFSVSSNPRYNTKKALAVYITGYLLVLLTGYGANRFMQNEMDRTPPKVEDTKGVAINADALAKEYNADEKAADGKYLNKTLEVSGTVSEVDKNQDGGVMIVLQTGDPSAGVQCAMREKGVQVAKGQAVTIKGFCSGNGITGVSLTDCVLK